MVSDIKKNIGRILSLALAIICLTTIAFADEPYTTYNYNMWNEAIPSQNGYIVDKVLTGKDMGLDQLADPTSPLFVSEDEPTTLLEATDLYLSPNNEFYIVDTGHDRILRFDINLQLIGCYKTLTGSKMTTKPIEGTNTEDFVPVPLDYFNNPKGIYVDKWNNIYVADYDNERVVKFNLDGEVIKEYGSPDTEIYKGSTFKPSKVIADNAENVYCIVASVNMGAVMYNKQGEFVGYYGANRVEVTAEVLLQQFWRRFASEEQLKGMKKNAPVEYANFDIDDNGFIYTVTEAANATTDAVKKMNAAGVNIWNNATGNTYVFGDKAWSVWYGGVTYQSRLTDIVVGDNGLINVLDYSSGRVFQYDRECNLLFIFGCSSDSQKGGFRAPNAIETYGKNIYILDGRKNDVTIFKETTFGAYVHEANEFFLAGRYEDSAEIWHEVIKRDGNYSMAYIGVGRSLLNTGKYKEAMEYFEIAFDQTDYDRAFKFYRQEWLKANFGTIVWIAVVIIAIIYIYSKLKKKGIVKPIKAYLPKLKRRKGEK